MKARTWRRRRSLALPLVVAAASALARGADAAQDLAKVCAGRLDYDEHPCAVDWTVGSGDVWALSEFRYALRGKLELECGTATVVIGKHTDAKGRKSTVWAALLPAEPFAITSSEPGHGQRARALFLRVQPSLVGELFPMRTVAGPVDPLLLIPAVHLPVVPRG